MALSVKRAGRAVAVVTRAEDRAGCPARAEVRAALERLGGEVEDPQRLAPVAAEGARGAGVRDLAAPKRARAELTPAVAKALAA